VLKLMCQAAPEILEDDWRGRLAEIDHEMEAPSN